MPGLWFQCCAAKAAEAPELQVEYEAYPCPEVEDQVQDLAKPTLVVRPPAADSDSLSTASTACRDEDACGRARKDRRLSSATSVERSLGSTASLTTSDTLRAASSSGSTETSRSRGTSRSSGSQRAPSEEKGDTSNKAARARAASNFSVRFAPDVKEEHQSENENSEDTDSADECQATTTGTPKRNISYMSTAMVRSASTRIIRRMSRRHSTLRTAARRIPAPAVPKSTKPLHTGHLRRGSVPEVKAVLTDVEACPMVRFLREVLACHTITTTTWRECSEIPGTFVRKAHWFAPLPPDVPQTFAKLLRIPETIAGTSVWRLKEDGGKLMLVQHSYTSDVLYGERFKMQSTLVIQDSASGVSVENFADTIWTTPLPWTHAAVKHFIERKVRIDTASTAGDLVRFIEEALGGRETAAKAEC